MGEALAGEIREVKSGVDADGGVAEAEVVARGELGGGDNAVVGDYVFVPGVWVGGHAHGCAGLDVFGAVED